MMADSQVEDARRVDTETDEQPADAAGQDEHAAPHRAGLANLVRNSSGYLVSMLVHMIIMVVLGVLALDVVDEAEVLSAITASSEEAVDDLEQEIAMIDFSVDDLELDQEALPFEVSDPGMADFGDLASDAAAADSGSVAMIDSGVMSEIGMLFGNEGQGMATMGDGTGGATFFGVKAGGNTFAFVVDGSRSMNGGRWEACKVELLNAARHLKPYQRFYVVLFAADAYCMFDEDHPAPWPVPATEENIRKLAYWLESFELVLKTLPYEAVKIALEMNPDAIYLLSDGQFSDGTEKYLQEHNRIEEDFSAKMKPKAVVHTIAFFSDTGKELLSRVAKANGGTFRYVPKPEGLKRGAPKLKGFQPTKKK